MPPLHRHTYIYQHLPPSSAVVRVHPPRVEKLNSVCHLLFVASPSPSGDVVYHRHELQLADSRLDVGKHVGNCNTSAH